MTRRNQHQRPKATDSQLSQLWSQLSRISRNSSENTGLVIAYLSFLGFLAAGIFGIFGLLISQQLHIDTSQARETPPPITKTVIQQQQRVNESQ